jgi:hypothetical protein
VRQEAARLLRAIRRGALDSSPKLIQLLEAASSDASYTNPRASLLTPPLDFSKASAPSTCEQVLKANKGVALEPRTLSLPRPSPQLSARSSQGHYTWQPPRKVVPTLATEDRRWSSLQGLRLLILST